MRKGVLFDLDGTLWDSSQEVAQSWVQTLESCPDITRKPTVAEIQSVMGKVTEEIADILFAEVPPARRMEVIVQCLMEENAYLGRYGGKIFPGLVEMLKELKRRKYHLSIVSNCQVGYIETFLEYYGLEEYMDDFESYGGTGRPKGENIRLVIERNQLDRAVYVGDTKGDYEAAKLAGVPFIHTRTGYGSLEEETPVVWELGQVPDMAEKILGE